MNTTIDTEIPANIRSNPLEDKGLQANVSASVEAARQQFTAAVEILTRTEKGECTMGGGHCEVASFGGAKNLSVFKAVQDIVHAIAGDRAVNNLTTSTAKGNGRG